ncbi:MAG: PadR family transcriptional regulator [Candidatus Lokiarchaeota archaeon]|nr:PadR family transcriptional regulator [Candidatus Lokiarchaeota archaeon]
MSTDESTDLSHISFAVLGLVSEHPCHGKDINERIKKRGMRAWTAIGESSVYGVLKNLKEKELVDSWSEEENNRLVKIYKITVKGTKLLKKKIFKVLNEFIGRNDPDFYMAFSMLPYLTEEEQVEVFTNSLNTIKKHKLELEKMLAENSKMPLNVRGLFIHPCKILQADIEFLEMVLDEIKRGGGKVDTKAYSK